MTAPQVVLAGRYRLVRLIATGGMGVVWEGWDEVLERPVAVKQLRTEVGVSDAEAKAARKRAMREARITARLHHPHAVPVFDAVEHEGQPCLIMQYLPSTPLSAMIRERGPLPPAEAARIGADVASALAAAHQLGIVHRDVKPGNVLLDEHGSALISDFGISHAVGDSTVTSTGLVHGTPAYLAPEVARGSRPDFASDVFSLGSTLYAAVEGAPPFGMDSNSIALLHRVATGSFDPPTRSGPLTALITAMLSTDPADRPTMQDAATHLAELAEQARREQAATAVLPAPMAAAAVEEEPIEEEPAEEEPAEEENLEAEPVEAEPVEAEPFAEEPAEAEPAGEPPVEEQEPADESGEEPDGIAALGLAGREEAVGDEHRTPAPVAPPPAAPVAAKRPAQPVSATAPLPVQGTAPSAGASASAPAALPQESPRRRRTALFAILALAAVLVLVVGGLLLSRLIPTDEDREGGGAGAPASETPSATSSATPTEQPSEEPSPSATPTPAATTPASSPTPAPTPPPPTAEERLVQSLTSYYGLLPGNRDAAWPLMTADYQVNHAGGRGGFEQFWSDVTAVSVTDVTATPPDGAQALVTYTFSDGRVVDEVTAYRFVDEGGVLKIAATDVLSSSTR